MNSTRITPVLVNKPAQLPIPPSSPIAIFLPSLFILNCMNVNDLWIGLLFRKIGEYLKKNSSLSTGTDADKD